MKNHEFYMQRALELAKKGGRAVAPNPMVGAVIVKDGEIIGEGYHQIFGAPHAEVNAIQSVQNKENLKDSTLYVTLEPCRHHGKQPPCHDLLEKSGIKKIFIGSRDPFQKPSNGQNFKFDIKFLEGEIASECKNLNKFFFRWITKKRPFITVKVATSADGFVAGESGQTIHFTSPEQDKQVHQLRADHQAILVGINTILNDDPYLNVRHIKGLDPLRVIVDSHLKISLNAKVLKDKNVLIATTCLTKQKNCPSSVQEKKLKLQENGFNIWESEGLKRVDLNGLFVYLAQKGISSALVEPGPTLYASLKKEQLIDELIVLKGKKNLEKGLKITF